jgi:hypothetical protein
MRPKQQLLLPMLMMMLMVAQSLCDLLGCVCWVFAEACPVVPNLGARCIRCCWFAVAAIGSSVVAVPAGCAVRAAADALTLGA